MREVFQAVIVALVASGLSVAGLTVALGKPLTPRIIAFAWISTAVCVIIIGVVGVLTFTSM